MATLVSDGDGYKPKLVKTHTGLERRLSAEKCLLYKHPDSSMNS